MSESLITFAHFGISDLSSAANSSGVITTNGRIQSRKVGGRFVVNYLEDAHSCLTIYETNGRKVTEVELPTLGTASGMTGRADNPEGFFSFTSFLYPTTIFRYDVATGALAVHRAPSIAFDPSRYETR